MSKGANGHAGRLPRLQIPVTLKQREALLAAAREAGADLNAWSLAQMMHAAQKHGGIGPVILSGEVAERIRSFAAAQDISPEDAVKQLLAHWVA